MNSKTYLASIVLMNVEKIPLSLFCAGGLAIVFTFINCPKSCDFCPWSAHLSPRAAKVLNTSAMHAADLVKRYRPDVVVFHGAEPYLNDSVVELMNCLAQHTSIPMGMKLKPSIAVDHIQLLHKVKPFLTFIIIEVVDDVDIKHLSTLFNHLRDVEHLEIALIVHKDNLAKLKNYTIEIYETLCKDIHVINYIPTEEIPYEVLSETISRLRRTYPLLTIPSAPRLDDSSILCPSCKMYIIVRSGGAILKMNILNDGACKYCNRKVMHRMPKKLIRIPIEEVLA